MLGKRNGHSVMGEMAVLLGDEPFEIAESYRNTICILNLKAYV